MCTIGLDTSDLVAVCNWRLDQDVYSMQNP